METKHELDNAHLWKITHPTTDKVSYLFGTLHELALKKQNTVLKPIFTSPIFDKIDLIITEIGDPERLINGPEFSNRSESTRAKMVKKVNSTMEANIANFGKEKDIPILNIENRERAKEAKEKASIENSHEMAEKCFKPKNLIKGVAIGLTFPIGVPVYIVQRIIKDKLAINKIKTDYMQAKLDDSVLSKAERTYVIENRNLFWLQHGPEINKNHPISSFDTNVKQVLKINDNNVEEDAFSLRSLLPDFNLFIAVGFAHLHGLIELLGKQGYIVTSIDPRQEFSQVRELRI